MRKSGILLIDKKSNKKESWILAVSFCSDYVDRVSGSGCRRSRVIEVVTDHSLVSTATFTLTGSVKNPLNAGMYPFTLQF